MKISSYNEWDQLKEIVVGTATNANWPINDPVFSKEAEKTTWTESAVPSGPVPQWIVDETNEDLDILANTLVKQGVTVHRPTDLDFPAIDGMYNYCPRDRLLIAGDVIVDTAMMYPCRDVEIDALKFVTDGNTVLHMPRAGSYYVLDAANICRLNDTWLFLQSWSGSRAAHQWLQEHFPHINIELVNFYSGVHIDSTVVPVREGVVLLNGNRVQPNAVPKAFKDWEVIWIDDVESRSFYNYPYASKWIGMNMLVVNPTTVIVDAIQTKIITKLEKLNFTVIPLELRHSRTLGGGFHCVTLDTWRQNV